MVFPPFVGGIAAWLRWRKVKSVAAACQAAACWGLVGAAVSAFALVIA
jgi:hypothetical protein